MRSSSPGDSSVNTYTWPSGPTRTSRIRLPRSPSRRSCATTLSPSNVSRIRLRSASAPMKANDARPETWARQNAMPLMAGDFGHQYSGDSMPGSVWPRASGMGWPE